MRTKVYEIPNKVIVEWDSSAKAIIETWISKSISLDEINEVVLIHGINFAKIIGVRAWIVNSQNTNGALSPEIQDFIKTQIVPAFVKIGVKYLITTNFENALTNLTITQYNAATESSDLTVLASSSVDTAIEWLKKNG